ncbi:MAG: HAMP domain-containing histidine kinase [Clostridia bacterium]|nr:HAMP domain-containing histidine kinase [Clostridia bacterium]
MKNRSIRFKLTLWFSAALIVVVGITLLAVLTASRAVLRGTIRDYLVGTVEENVDKIRFVTGKGDTAANSYIPYGEGYLQIDLDFMQVVNEVHTALYTASGVMLYGENPLSRQTGDLAFTESHIRYMKIKGVRYDLYDRKLDIPLPDGRPLWIRGVVPETKSAAQLGEITRLLLILLPILILLSVVSGYFLADRLLSPIRRIEKTAEEISAGDDLKKRIDGGGTRDEIGHLADVFNRMFDRLERSFEAEQRFTSDASHELRTPTAVILAQSEYTLEKERTPEEYVEALQVVQKQGKRMDALISDMLDYTRLEQSPERYVFETVDLSRLVSETAEQMTMVGTNGISLRTQVEEGVSVPGNPMLLSRLLQNLIGNAYRYGRENGHTTVSLFSDGGRTVLSVADDGIGIPREEQEKIFDRFYRGDASRSVRGTGLGLSMVKKIAELHGAGVEVESSPGEGSTFRIIFSHF